MDTAGVEIATRLAWLVPVLIIAFVVLLNALLNKQRKKSMENGEVFASFSGILSAVIIFAMAAWALSMIGGDDKVHRDNTKAALEQHYDIILDDMFRFTLAGVEVGQNAALTSKSRGLLPDGTWTDYLVVVVKDDKISLWEEKDGRLVELDH